MEGLISGAEKEIELPQCRSGHQAKHCTNLSHFHFSTDTAAQLNIHDNKLALTCGITGGQKNIFMLVIQVTNSLHKMHMFIFFIDFKSKCNIITEQTEKAQLLSDSHVFSLIKRQNIQFNYKVWRAVKL